MYFNKQSGQLLECLVLTTTTTHKFVKKCTKLHPLYLIKGKANEIDLDPALKKVMDLRQWFEKRLDDAIQAAEKEGPKPVKSLEEVDTAK